MAQPATERLLSADEFMRLPDPGMGGRFELVNGKVVAVTPPGGEHGERAGDIYAALRTFTRAHDLGRVTIESGYLLGSEPDTVRGPDVAFIRTSRLPGGVLPQSYIPSPPDLAIEVRSPWDRQRGIAAKVREYLDAGTGIVWVVDPGQRTVTIYRAGAAPVVRTEADTLDSADAGFAVDGFALPVAAIFS